MRWELVNDWVRDYDEIDQSGETKIFKFKGIRNFEEDIGQFGVDKGFKNVKIVTDNGNRVEWDGRV